MSLVSLIVTLVILGLVMWLVNQLPIEPPFKQIIQVIVILVLILWLLGLVGLIPGGVLRIN